MDSGQYGATWNGAAFDFKNSIDQPTWEKRAGAVRSPLGKVASRALGKATRSTTLPGAPDGDYVVMQFNASFEHKATAAETVTMMKDRDGVYRVAGYFIK